MGSWNLDIVERSLADAAVDPALWNNAMDTVARETGGVGAILLPLSDNCFPGVPSSESLQRSNEVYFRDGWHTHDERYRVEEILVRRSVAVDFDIIDSTRMKTHAYYQEFLRPHGLQYFAGVKMAAGDDIWVLSIQRSPAQGPFAPKEVRKLIALSRNIASAAALARALGFASATAAAEALELSGSAVALLDRRARVLRLNRAAEKLLGQDVKIARSRLTSYDHNATSALDRALHSLLWAGTGSALMQPVVLPRRKGRPILAYPLKLSSVSACALADCQALLVLVDLERRPRPPQEALKVAFALTPAEARLAVEISSGKPLDSIADDICISKQTARNQLKSIFQKTGVSRQSELVALLASFLHL